MFALLVPAGFALVVKVVKGNAHAQHAAAERKQKACAAMRGAAAGALPDADVEAWRERAVLATERIKGLESIITVRSARRGARRACACRNSYRPFECGKGRSSAPAARARVSRAAAPPSARTRSRAAPRAGRRSVASRARRCHGLPENRETAEPGNVRADAACAHAARAPPPPRRR
jgi:hypothetical protein